MGHYPGDKGAFYPAPFTISTMTRPKKRGSRSLSPNFMVNRCYSSCSQKKDIWSHGRHPLFPETHRPSLQEKPLELTMETASTMHSSREESCQPSPTAPLDARPATQPALHVQPPNLPAAPMGPMPMLGPDGLPLPNLLAGRGGKRWVGMGGWEKPQKKCNFWGWDPLR